MINTQSGKDFTYGSHQLIDDEFEALFYFIMQSVEAINQMNDQTAINIEVSKIRSKLRKLITKYFHTSAAQLSFNPIHKEDGKRIMARLNTIVKTLEL